MKSIAFLVLTIRSLNVINFAIDRLDEHVLRVLLNYKKNDLFIVLLLLLLLLILL